VKSKQKSLLGKAVFPLGYQSKARLTVWKGMATWCPACARYRPYFEHLKAMTQGLGVEFRGFPLDETEGREALVAYQNNHNLPYDLQTDLSMLDRKKAEVFLERWIGAAELPYPTSVVTNQLRQKNRIQSNTFPCKFEGIPWISTLQDIRNLLDNSAENDSYRLGLLNQLLPFSRGAVVAFFPIDDSGGLVKSSIAAERSCFVPLNT